MNSVIPLRPVSEPLLNIEGLRVSFLTTAGASTVVDGVSLSLHRGRCLAIVGESGSGKSVTARSLVGLAGAGATVSWNAMSVAGRDASHFSESDWRRVRGKEIGLVFQDAMVALDPLRTIGREVAEAIRVHGLLPDGAIPARVEQLLSDVGIPDPRLRAGQYPHQLSGGLRQRALIASALAASPSVLIADEPTTALDVTVQRQILDLLQTLKDAGIAILLISHDLGVVARLADDVLVMKDGQVVERGSVQGLLANPSQAYTRELINAVPQFDRGRKAAVARLNAAHQPGDAETVAIRASGLSKRYELLSGQSHHAMKDVSFTLSRGECLGIVGESGSGKSTVARTLLGVLAPDAGSVEVFGTSWADLDRRVTRALRRRIQIVYQDTASAFNPRMTVLASIGEALAETGVPRAGRRKAAADLLAQVGLDEKFLDRKPSQLSGGQRQRVAIARALAMEPDILVCDEPVSALDATVQAQVLELLADFRRNRGLTMIFVSHDLAVVGEIADRVLVMQGGRIVEEGEIGRVFDAPSHPYTARLLASVLSLPADTRQRTVSQT